jgi:hypothetical protein
METKLFCFLEIIGITYKASINPQGSILYLKLGFCQKVSLVGAHMEAFMETSLN